MNLGPLTFWPAAFWLVPPVLAALVWLRFYRLRRQEVLAGSLLIWRRLAAQQPKAPPKRFEIDRSLLIQTAAMLALIAAMAAPSLVLSQSRGRGLLLVLDNGSISRFRSADGAPLLNAIKAKAEGVLKQLRSNDVVFIARSAPLPKLLTPSGVSPSQALETLAGLQPALTHRPAADVWREALDTAALLSRDAGVGLAVISLSAKPAPDSPEKAWLCAAPEATLNNVGIIDFGSVQIAPASDRKVQTLVRIKNFSAGSAAGTVRLQTERPPPEEAQAQTIDLAGGEEQALVFTVNNVREPLRIEWQTGIGKADALPEDDALVASPQPLRVPRVRFHTSIPALEKLYASALDAEFLKPGQSEAADLEIYAGSVPERVPAGARGVLLLAPQTGYQSIFDVGLATLNWPKAQRDETNDLTRGIGDKVEGLFAVPRALEILRTGDFTSLVKDARTQRTLVARFQDQQQRFGLVLSFVPGDGFAAGRLLEPDLAAILIRAALEAAGSGDPFIAARAEAAELKQNEPLELSWRARFEDTPRGGVLNEKASQPALGGPDSATFNTAGLQPVERGASIELRPWLVLLALGLLAWESLGSRAKLQ
ncbi:MAG TPA: hypothetical protein VEK08_24865 [Planctomycetota bacterium]|nr:hypothetical protein [Planctomycetota bacterium]